MTGMGEYNHESLVMFFYVRPTFLYVLLQQRQRRVCELELLVWGMSRGSKESKVSGKNVSDEHTESLTWVRKEERSGGA